MRFARLTIAEFKIEESVSGFVNDYAALFDANFAMSEGSIMIRTGPTTVMNLIMLPDNNAVSASLEKRKKFMNDRKHLLVQEETFFYEGEVMWAKLFNGNQDQPITKEQQSQLDAMQAQITELQTMLSQVLSKLPS